LPRTHLPPAIGSVTATVSSPDRCSVVCTMSIISSRWLHEPTLGNVHRFCRSQAQKNERQEALASLLPFPHSAVSALS
jgi:hypothetical protein